MDDNHLLRVEQEGLYHQFFVKKLILCNLLDTVGSKRLKITKYRFQHIF